MFFGADDVRDLHVMVVDDGRQMVEARTIGPLDDVVLFAGPLEADFASDEIVDEQLALARHFESDDGLPALGLELGRLRVGLGHPAAAISKLLFGLLGLLSFGLDLFGLGKITRYALPEASKASTAAWYFADRPDW